jgi:hypothetical protein
MRASLAVIWAVTLAASVSVHAAPVTAARITELCAQADGPAHCGRLIEADQLKTLPNLAVRDGATLKVLLFPSGAREFVDVDSLAGGTTWSLWDYWSPVNVVVLYTTDLDRIGYATLQRTTGQVVALPAEPSLSPDRQRLAVADFCRANCDNEVSVWRIARDGISKEYGWKPDAEWSDVTLQWKGDNTVVVEFTPKGDDKARTLERRMTDPGWQRYGSRPPQ